jgi:hypothetical protein
MKISYASGVMETIEKRGIKKEDIEDILSSVGDDYITDGKECLAKSKVGDLTVYVRFAGEDQPNVLSAYTHRMAIQDIVLVGDETPWRYKRNGGRVMKGHTNLSYLGATRSGPSLVEPISGESWFEEYLAVGALTAAEGLFQQKRA